MATAFAASADFAIDKPAGRPCTHLGAGFRCGIHDRLRPAGFTGCAVFDCFGAGQRVAQVTFAGRDWRRHPDLAAGMFEVFGVMRQLHELLWYLAEAAALPAAGPVRRKLRAASDQIERLAAQPPGAVLGVDVPALRRDANVLLRRASELVRAAAGGPGVDRGGADLIGADLRGADLRGASLRGAYLIAADLRGADLGRADLTGADLRGADLRGADLTGAIFVTQAQLDAARGDATTRVPGSLRRPAHWPARRPAPTSPSSRRGPAS